MATFVVRCYGNGDIEGYWDACTKKYEVGGGVEVSTPLEFGWINVGPYEWHYGFLARFGFFAAYPGVVSGVPPSAAAQITGATLRFVTVGAAPTTPWGWTRRLWQAWNAPTCEPDPGEASWDAGYAGSVPVTPMNDPWVDTDPNLEQQIQAYIGLTNYDPTSANAFCLLNYKFLSGAFGTSWGNFQGPVGREDLGFDETTLPTLTVNYAEPGTANKPVRMHNRGMVW